MSVHHILIIEDQRDLARMLVTGLKSLGPDYKVVAVPSGEEALLVANSQSIDLAVIDVILPGMSGLELLDSLRARQPHIKVILITGAEDDDIRHQVTNAGVEAYFFKPIEFAHLMEAVRAGLEPAPAPPPLPPEIQEVIELEVDVDPEKEPRGDTISNRLSTLRQELMALSVVLLDDRGRPLVQAGDFPEVLKPAVLIPALMGVFSAGGKVSHVLGAPAPEDIFAFAGPAHTLHLAHVGGTYALVIITDPATGSGGISRVAHSILDVIPELIGGLEYMGVPVDTGPLEPEPVPAPEVMVEEEIEDLPELDALFRKAAETQLSTEEVDAFWAPPVKSMDTGSLHADDLTYDQAEKLGFTPEDELETEE
jgi:DNA-binding response OmpR family regulator